VVVVVDGDEAALGRAFDRRRASDIPLTRAAFGEKMDFARRPAPRR
jgi:hypothetical protein